MSKWSKSYWSDLAERVGSVAIYGVITLLTTAGATPLEVDQLWPIVGLPVALSFLKGILANLADSDSGASLLPVPPGPPVNRDEAGQVGLVYILAIVAVVLLVLLLAPALYR